MQLSILQASLSDFAVALSRGWASGLEPLYETVGHWQDAWPPGAPDELAATLDRALANSTSRAFWQGHAYDPKAVLLQFAGFAPEVLNMAFGRLFSEKEDLGGRLRGFVFYLDEILGELRRKRPLKAPPTHYHDDYRAASLYCALRFPQSHAYLEAERYLQALKLLKARDVGTVADPDRFAKTVKVIGVFVAKTDGLREAHTERTRHTAAYPDSALLASEYIRFLTA